MATKYDDTMNGLSAPFPKECIEWRVSQAGKTKDGKVWALVLPYITSRAVMDRLDEVIGWENWSEDITEISGGFMHRLTIVLPDGKTVTKCDGADRTDYEAIKGGISNSLKRVAVKFGIGRYLYGLNKRYFATITEGKGQHRDKFKDKETNKDIWFFWDEPEI